jgi:hypothetical protein
MKKRNVYHRRLAYWGMRRDGSHIELDDPVDAPRGPVEVTMRSVAEQHCGSVERIAGRFATAAGFAGTKKSSRALPRKP